VSAFLDALAALESPGQDSADALKLVFAEIMDGKADDGAITRFLIASQKFLDKPLSLAIGSETLRARMIGVTAPAGTIDVCGTGGDGAHTLNISTAVAFVAAGAGVRVAKHGNRAISSKSGAADVLEALGVPLTADIPTLERAMREARVAFLFAQNHHPAMRHVAAARKALGKRTIFNLLGPLANPCGVKRQIIGVASMTYVQPMAKALQFLGAERAIVLHGAGGLDEMSFADDGASLQWVLLNTSLAKVEMEPSYLARSYGAPLHATAELKGGTAQHNAAALHALLSNTMQASAYENAVLLNASFALSIAGRAPAGPQAWDAAKESLRSGAALAALERLIAITQGAP
jgi:anthranilate phosphoribosyltransferase